MQLTELPAEVELMRKSLTELLELRASISAFDDTHTLDDADIRELVRLAALSPNAYHLQNWRFIAVRKADSKARLRALAHDQPKVTAAAVTFIVCGQMPDHRMVPERLRPLVEAGFMSEGMVLDWQRAVLGQYANTRLARDEAIRSASLAAATLMIAAQAMGLGSGAMGGFDPVGVGRSFGLSSTEIPAMLVAVGRTAPGNWPQKPRRSLDEVLEFA